MRSFSRVAVVGLILIWMMTPGMACVLPGGQLTEEQSECCRDMDGECDSMPFSESCCTTTVQAPQVSLVVQSYSSFAPELVAATLPAEIAPALPSFGGPRNSEASIHSPPNPTAGLSTILRV